MRKGGQGEKGGAYERKVGELFTQAYYPEGGGEFKRVPKGFQADPRIVSNDLMALKRVSIDSEQLVIDQSFPMSLECKDWRDENVKHFFSGLYSAESTLYEWMEQAISGASIAGKIPIVIFKLFRTDNIVMTLSKELCKISELFGEFPGKLYKLFRVEGGATVELSFVLLKDFLSWIDWEHYRLAGKVKFLRSIIKKND